MYRTKGITDNAIKNFFWRSFFENTKKEFAVRQ